MEEKGSSNRSCSRHDPHDDDHHHHCEWVKKEEQCIHMHTGNLTNLYQFPYFFRTSYF